MIRSVAINARSCIYKYYAVVVAGVDDVKQNSISVTSLDDKKI